jgi:tetratricopeptide (TPR) repeat protein
MARLGLFAPLAASAAFLAPAPLLADAPGGGGGSAPSMSAPQYDAAAEYRKGIEALQASQFEAAKKAFDRVLAVAPADANSNFLAGLAAAGLGDLKSARAHYEKAVRADHELVQAHRELGITYSKLGDKPKAQAELDRLNQMQQKCSATCAKAADIGAAIQALTAALAGALSRLEGANESVRAELVEAPLFDFGIGRSEGLRQAQPERFWGSPCADDRRRRAAAPCRRRRTAAADPRGALACARQPRARPLDRARGMPGPAGRS